MKMAPMIESISQDRNLVSRLRSSQQVGISLLAFLIAFLVLFLRRPDALLNAQFWAEDGAVWFSKIFNQGFIGPLFSPQDGYFQTISRLTMGIAALFPLEMAPFVSNTIGLMIRASLLCFLFTPRMGWVGNKEKLVIGAYYLLMPGILEVHPNITNAHWYLSIYLCMVLSAEAPKRALAKIHDMAILVISGLSGPFVVFIAPFYGMKYLMDNEWNILRSIKRYCLPGSVSKLLFNLAFVVICLIQVGSILVYSSGRSSAPLGLSLEVLSNILSARIFLGSFIPHELIAYVWQLTWLNAGVSLLSLSLLVYAMLRGGWRMTLFVGFAAIMIGFALSKPQISLDQPQLPLLMHGAAGGRYFIITNIVWFSVLVFVSSRQTLVNKSLLLGLLFCMVFVSSWFSFKVDKLEDLHYQRYVEQYYQLKPGEVMEIPLNPGGGWKMGLIRKED
jgi:hypothetical protein